MLKHSELVLKLLEKRGITKEKEIEEFLNPDYEKDMLDPFLMRDMTKSCERLLGAIQANEKIIIYADYDCDGIPGAVILHDLLQKIGYKNYEVYIPERNSEGYGLNMEAIEEFSKNNVQLIITIDLGITANKEIEKANEYGINIIVTDHHIAHHTLPKAYAILNPKVDDYPEKMLCGAGVMFKFVQGFIKRYGEKFKINLGWEKWLLDMAGLATLSDMVPLVGENRTIAYYGLKVFRKSPRPGLQKLLAKMNIEQKTISEDDIGFMVTPRLNAASRMDSPMHAFDLLSTNNEIEAGMLADHLTKINDERKHLVLGYMKHVKKVFENREIREVIVIGAPEWRVGVLGIVAGKIADEYNKTVFVWGRDENNIIKGSCRSPEKCSVVELMTQTSEFFIDFGGHELAGGFTVHNDKIHFLEDALNEVFEGFKRQNPKRIEEGAQGLALENQNYDIKLSLADVNIKNWNEMEKMAPFGFGNPKPIFLFENVIIEKVKAFGKNGSGEHLEIEFSDESLKSPKKMKGISFFSGLDSFSREINESEKVSLLATFDLSRFRGRPELRLRIVDII